MAIKSSKRLVIDASVARAAGEIKPPAVTEHQTSKSCRDFLLEVKKICHKIVMTDDIRLEWEKVEILEGDHWRKGHQSRFSSRWLATMQDLDKLVELGESHDDLLRSEIEESASDKHLSAIMLKDVHLVEGALLADHAIVSLEDRCLNHFIAIADKVPKLKQLVWINPAKAEEQPIQWLRQGAKLEKERRLGYLTSLLR